MMKRMLILLAAAALLQMAGGRAGAQYISSEVTPEKRLSSDEAAAADKKVADAKKLIEEKGEAAFDDFQKNPDKWLGKEQALHIINATEGDENEGLFVIYPQPKYVGEGAFYMPLVNGKPYIAITHGVGADKDEAGWFRLMRDTSEEKFHHAASLAKAPGGKTYAIVAATDNLYLQKLFIKEMVKAACLFMRAQGEEAFNRFSRKGTIFEFKDTYVYVMDTEGRILFDPGLPQYVGKTVAEVGYFKRSAGLNFMSALQAYLEGDMPSTSGEAWDAWMRVLRKEGKVWGIYLAPLPGEEKLSVKASYCRLITAMGKEYVVGSGIYLVDYGRLADPAVMERARKRVDELQRKKEAERE